MDNEMKKSSQMAPDDSEATEARELGDAPSGGEAAGAIQSIQEGFEKLEGMLAQAQGAVTPEDLQLFQVAKEATDAFVQSISGAAPEKPEAPAPGGPMAANAGSKSVPAGY